MNLASGVGGKTDKSQVLSAVENGDSSSGDDNNDGGGGGNADGNDCGSADDSGCGGTGGDCGGVSGDGGGKVSGGGDIACGSGSSAGGRDHGRGGGHDDGNGDEVCGGGGDASGCGSCGSGDGGGDAGGRCSCGSDDGGGGAGDDGGCGDGGSSSGAMTVVVTMAVVLVVVVARKVNKYYDLATSFYEFGWGQSFHFAPRWKRESLQESIKRHEHFIALQLGLKPGQKVLDVGCGIGGPLREISRFSLTSITGLNNNEYQITRAKVSDFMKMPFPDNSFDVVYAIEATCHAPDVYACYKEVFRVLNLGQSFAAYEWCITKAFDPNNEEHQKIKAEIEVGDALPDIRLTTKCVEALKQAEFVGLAPRGSLRVEEFLQKAVEGLVEGGKKEIFTPLYFFLARKPDLAVTKVM
ncbi:Cycloartenol-C-24-methyltransferase protein [Spatholobus suberectus]|nr:Cycloartenol-C-24-methyltransferase protein [Spatholobus suberectus]